MRQRYGRRLIARGGNRRGLAAAQQLTQGQRTQSHAAIIEKVPPSVLLKKIVVHEKDNLRCLFARDEFVRVHDRSSDGGPRLAMWALRRGFLQEDGFDKSHLG